jgi:hypothetical protein
LSYQKRITALQESLNLLETQIKNLPKTPTDIGNPLRDAIQQKTNIEREIVRLSRLQWEEDREFIEFDE